MSGLFYIAKAHEEQVHVSAQKTFVKLIKKALRIKISSSLTLFIPLQFVFLYLKFQCEKEIIKIHFSLHF